MDSWIVGIERLLEGVKHEEQVIESAHQLLTCLLDDELGRDAGLRADLDCFM